MQDEITLLSENKEGFEEMLNTVKKLFESYGMKENKSKIIIMVCGKMEQTKIGIKIGRS